MFIKFVSRLGRATGGQDLIEYALMAGFVAVAAGAIMPNVSNNISMTFAKIEHTFCVANAGVDGGAKQKCETNLKTAYSLYEKEKQ